MAESFEEELVDCGEGLFRFALTITRDPHLAADLVQDTYLRAWEKRSQYRGEAPLASWLRRILHNLAVDRARREVRQLAVAEVEDRWMDDSYSVDPEAVVEQAETREELEDALVRLPFIYREAVLLHDVEGWTARAIADLTGVSLPAAKQRLRRGRMMLVTALADGHERRAKLKGVPMRCWDARRLVSDYLDGALDRGEAELVEAHLGSCPTCPPLYAALVGVRDRLGGMRDADSVIPPELGDRIRAVLG